MFLADALGNYRDFSGNEEVNNLSLKEFASEMTIDGNRLMHKDKPVTKELLSTTVKLAGGGWSKIAEEPAPVTVKHGYYQSLMDRLETDIPLQFIVVDDEISSIRTGTETLFTSSNMVELMYFLNDNGVSLMEYKLDDVPMAPNKWSRNFQHYRIIHPDWIVNVPGDPKPYRAGINMYFNLLNQDWQVRNELVRNGCSNSTVASNRLESVEGLSKEMLFALMLEMFNLMMEWAETTRAELESLMEIEFLDPRAVFQEIFNSNRLINEAREAAMLSWGDEWNGVPTAYAVHQAVTSGNNQYQERMIGQNDPTLYARDARLWITHGHNSYNWMQEMHELGPDRAEGWATERALLRQREVLKLIEDTGDENPGETLASIQKLSPIYK